MYLNEQLNLLNNNIERFNQEIIDDIDNITKIYQKYNAGYAKYTTNYKKAMEDAFNNFNIKPFISTKYGGSLYETESNKENFISIDNCLKNYINTLKDLRYLDFLSEEKRNVVLIGPNGCGKTTLLRHLKHMTGEKEIAYFQADRLLLVNSDYNPERDESAFLNSYTYTFKNATDINISNQSFYVDRQFNLVITLFEKIRSEELELINSGDLKSENCKTNYILSIWNQLIQDRILFCRGTLKVKTLNNQEYSIKYLSSGEKAIFYFLSSIILNEQKQYYFIDEPENNLNPSIVSKLWNILEHYYPSSIFIYLTHDSNFVSSRVNTKIYWIQKYDGKNWEYKSLPENDNLPRELMISLVGNRQPVLFCESENEGKFDTIVYKIMFPEFKVVSAGGCDKVRVKTKAYNDIGLPHSAFGIIDCDYKSEDYLDGQESNNIFHLPFFEIENFLISEEILKPIIEKFIPNKTNAFDTIKTLIKNNFIQQKDKWIIRKIGFDLRSLHFNNKIHCLSTLDDLKGSYKSYQSNIDIDQKYTEYSDFYDSVIAEDNYNRFLRYYDNKNNLFKLIEKEINIPGFKYEDEVLEFLNNEGQPLSKYLREKYFKNIKM